MSKISKSKITVAIVIGIMSFMMIYVILIQINIVKEYDGEEIELMRETELKETLATYKEKYEETTNELNSTVARIEEYKADEKSEEDAVALLEEEVNQANMLLGKTDVTGEGIIITIENTGGDSENEAMTVNTADLINLVNELRLAGAEAISINGERIVANSDIFDVGNFIYINGQRTTSPYEIKVIGDRKYLESALNIKGGYIDVYTLNGYNIKMESSENIVIGKYEGEMTLNYVKR